MKKLFTDINCKLHLGNNRKDICDICKACEYNKTKMEKKIVTVRINSRVRPDQKEYIKRYAERKNISEGETHRLIIDAFINLKEK